MSMDNALLQLLIDQVQNLNGVLMGISSDFGQVKAEIINMKSQIAKLETEQNNYEDKLNKVEVKLSEALSQMGMVIEYLKVSMGKSELNLNLEAGTINTLDASTKNNVKT